MTAQFTPASALEVSYGLALVVEPKWLTGRRVMEFVVTQALLDERPYSREPFPLSCRKVADWIMSRNSETWVRQVLRGLEERQCLALDSVGCGGLESEYYACHPTHWRVRFRVAPEELGRRLAIASALAAPLERAATSRGVHRTRACATLARHVSAGRLAPVARGPWDPREVNSRTRGAYDPRELPALMPFSGGSKDPLSEQEQSELRSKINSLTAAVSHSTGLKTIYGSPRDRIAGLAASANGHWAAVLAAAAGARGRLIQDLLDDLEEIARGEHVVAAGPSAPTGAELARAKERRRLEAEIAAAELAGEAELVAELAERIASLGT